MYIFAINNTYLKHCNRAILKAEYPDTAFPTDFLRRDNPTLQDYGIYYCEQLAKPEYDATNFNCIDADPVYLNGSWVQGWLIVPKTDFEKRDVVPVVTMTQAKIALYRRGKLADVEQLIEQAGGELKLWWNTQAYMHRSSPLVDAVAQQLGWSEQFVNELFQLATTI